MNFGEPRETPAKHSRNTREAHETLAKRLRSPRNARETLARGVLRLTANAASGDGVQAGIDRDNFGDETKFIS